MRKVLQVVFFSLVCFLYDDLSLPQDEPYQIQTRTTVYIVGIAFVNLFLVDTYI